MHFPPMKTYTNPYHMNFSCNTTWQQTIIKFKNYLEYNVHQLLEILLAFSSLKIHLLLHMLIVVTTGSVISHKLV
uniref:Uncharacterized protein n=1 Tax=Rhizophora mucronata TaxID=61149 RepID=A0A2P2QN16_RHIMU